MNIFSHECCGCMQCVIKNMPLDNNIPIRNAAHYICEAMPSIVNICMQRKNIEIYRQAVINIIASQGPFDDEMVNIFRKITEETVLNEKDMNLKLIGMQFIPEIDKITKIAYKDGINSVIEEIGYRSFSEYRQVHINKECPFKIFGQPTETFPEYKDLYADVTGLDAIEFRKYLYDTLSGDSRPVLYDNVTIIQPKYPKFDYEQIPLPKDMVVQAVDGMITKNEKKSLFSGLFHKSEKY